MQGLVEEGEEIIQKLSQGPVRDAALIAAAQKVEHYEIAAYGTICTILKSMGETQAGNLLGQSLQEEKETDQRLTTIAEQEVNPAALSGQGANDPTGRSRGAA